MVWCGSSWRWGGGVGSSVFWDREGILWGGMDDVTAGFYVLLFV